MTNLCGALDVPISSTQRSPELALLVLSQLYMVPTIKERLIQNRVVNDIRRNLDGHLDPYSVFIQRTYQLAWQMQEFPHWFDHLNKSTEELVELYKDIDRGKFWIGSLAVGGAATAGGAGAAGIAEAIKKKRGGGGNLLEVRGRRLTEG